MLMSTLLVGQLRDFAVLLSLHREYKAKFSLTTYNSFVLKVGRVIFTLEEAMKAQSGGRSTPIALLSL